ncbi:MAG: methionine biosynthesis protein MetW [Candidatus Competibacteraceae bacterium]
MSAWVLDLGCGDGALLAYLHEYRRVRRLWTGNRLPANIVKCIQAGVNVIHADLEAGLADFGDGSFDYVIMTQTLQAVRRTEALLDEMLRVGTTERHRDLSQFLILALPVQTALQGLMPVVKTLPYQWYDTPNIHLFTIRDFEKLCRSKHIDILQRTVMDHAHRPRLGPRLWPNLLGEIALYRLGRA